MAKPKLYGYQRNYLPNNRADSRRRKLWEHNRQIAKRDALAIRQEKARFYAQAEERL